MNPHRLGVAIIGAGHMGHVHADAFNKFGDKCKLIAVCDSDVEKATRLGEKFGIKGRYTVVADLLYREKPDCVVICSPTYLHCSQTLESLAAGASVLCEKPMAMNLDECFAMKQAAESTGRALYIGFNHRLYSKFSCVRDILKVDDLGELTSVVSAIGHGGWKSHNGSWFTKKEYSGGGAFMTCGIHMLDMLGWYGFEITKVFATMQRRLLDGDCEEDGIATFQFKNGAIGSLHASYIWVHPYTQQMRLNFEAGSVDIRHSDIIVSRVDKPAQTHIDCFEADSFKLQASCFLEAAMGQQAFVSAIDGTNALAIALAAYRSSGSNTWETV